MREHPSVDRLLVGLAILVLLGGCASGASPSPAPASSSPAGNPSATFATRTTDVAYEGDNPLLKPGVLDVYAPAKAGPWPVVVMFHGAPQMVSKSDLGNYARKVADLGFVVFVPNWGHETAGGAEAFTYEAQVAVNSQAACAVAFARAHAAEYGGDPATMIVFGRSGGANTGAMVAFARPEPSAGCLGGTTLGAISALVTWEGSWILSVPSSWHDPALAADPRVMDALTPWTYLAEHKDLKVVMLVSEYPGADLDREVGDPWAADSWLAMRDPSGDLRRQLEANGAFADGTLAFTEVQQLLFSVLEAQGNPVSLDVMPGSTHEFLSYAGWDVFLAAFPKAAGWSPSPGVFPRVVAVAWCRLGVDYPAWRATWKDFARTAEPPDPATVLATVPGILAAGGAAEAVRADLEGLGTYPAFAVAVSDARKAMDKFEADLVAYVTATEATDLEGLTKEYQADVGSMEKLFSGITNADGHPENCPAVAPGQ